jgi:dTDP-4-dehydrorhamnose reductase
LVEEAIFMKIAVTGASGTLGGHLIELLNANKEHSISQFSLLKIIRSSETNAHLRLETAINDWITGFRPHIIIHCAACTDVDGCEGNPQEAMFYNTDYTRFLANAAKEIGSRFVLISTSAIYGGNSNIVSNELDPFAPLNYYAKSKLAAEEVVRQSGLKYAIYRAGWMIDTLSQSNKFVGRVYENLQKGAAKAVIDKYASLTSAKLLAKLIIENISLDAAGDFNVGSANVCSRFDVAYLLAQILGLNKPLPCLSNSFPLAAERGIFEGLTTCKPQIYPPAYRLWQELIIDMVER